MVFQDGVRHYLNEDGEFRVPVVFDNLIHAKEMPVTIAVFIDPGFRRTEFPAASDTRARPENRSVEYDTLSPDYDYKYVFGEGAHNGNHGGAIFPDTMRWLWRDDPRSESAR